MLQPTEQKLNQIHTMLLEALREVDILQSGCGTESLKLHANMHICLRDEHGNIKQQDYIHNIICTAGKNKLLAVSGGEALTAFLYVAIGTSATAVAIGDTTLGTEVARSPIQTATNPTAAQYQVTYTFPAGTGTGTIVEAGLLDAASTGNLLAHQTFGAYTKAAGDTLQIIWQIS